MRRGCGPEQVPTLHWLLPVRAIKMGVTVFSSPPGKLVGVIGLMMLGVEVLSWSDFQDSQQVDLDLDKVGMAELIGLN